MGFKKQTPDYIATCEVDKLRAQYVSYHLEIYLKT